MPFICNLCKVNKENSEVINLKCKHIFCWTCIDKYLKNNLQNKIKCPEPTCVTFMKDSQVRKILSEDDIQRYEDICLGKIRDGFKCLLPECSRVVVLEGTNMQFDCTNCTLYNCTGCKLSHRGLNCDELESLECESRDLLCQKEMDRANTILQANLVKSKRDDIIKMDKMILISNPGIFNCQLCFTDIAKNKGVTIRNCFHEICRTCLSAHIINSAVVPVNCPFPTCHGTLEDRECREVLSDTNKVIYETKSIRLASKYLDKAEHCRQFNCDYLCDLAQAVNSWTCPKCNSLNCVSCNAIHSDQTCEEYQSTKILSLDEQKIEDQIKSKKLMRCLECNNIIMKKGGCNWISCRNCGVELCWATQNYRWGPKGPGDVTGGCMCGVNGKMCHPTCGGCVADVARRHSRYQSLTPQRSASFGFFNFGARLNQPRDFDNLLDMRPIPRRDREDRNNPLRQSLQNTRFIAAGRPRLVRNLTSVASNRTQNNL